MTKNVCSYILCKDGLLVCFYIAVKDKYASVFWLEPSLRDKYAIGWHCPRWLRHLFSSLVVKKSFPRKTFVEHTSPLLFQRFDDRNVRSRKKEFKLKMG